ncbi:MAG: hypothetical protein LBI20_00880 [Holosporales bacterium]|nr:hypothetical protein [Holosporales bacterium]
MKKKPKKVIARTAEFRNLLNRLSELVYIKYSFSKDGFTKPVYSLNNKYNSKNHGASTGEYIEFRQGSSTRSHPASFQHATNIDIPDTRAMGKVQPARGAHRREGGRTG